MVGVVALFSFSVSGFAQPTKEAEPSSVAAEEVTPRVGPSHEPSGKKVDVSEIDILELLDPTVTTASKEDEKLGETPVPVTVITGEMIRSIGARNLQDVLITFVPGMTLVADHNEMNVAMRGVYASSQQKILMLLDGHRLNSRAYSMANPDHSLGLGLARIKQIEVLRGPGSSVYGNQALTAVVNIVTEDAAKIDGSHVQIGMGDKGQKIANATYGKEFSKNNALVLWGTFYEATGEVVHIDINDDYSDPARGGEAIVGGTFRPGSHDVGLRYQVGDFHLMFDNRFGKLTEPFTSAGRTGEIYDHDQIRTFMGIGPGLGSRSTHAEAGWSHQVTENLNIDLTANYDTNAVLGNLVSSEANDHIFLTWNDRALGGVAQARARYDFGAVGNGNLLVGAQLDDQEVLDSALPTGTAGDWTLVADAAGNRVLKKGHETIYSGFAQLKHRFLPSLSFNAGVRYDYKQRRSLPGNPVGLETTVTAASPRVAIIVAPVHVFDVKLSYSESFVDAPYWYRYNNLAAYQGAFTLTPEHLRTMQLTPRVRFFDDQLQSTLNVAYNDLYDFIYRNNDALPGEPLYQNAGELTTLVLEEELAWVSTWYRVYGVATYQHVLRLKSYAGNEDDNQIANVPSLTANLVLDVNPIWQWYKKAWLNVNVRYIGEQLGPIAVSSKNYPAPRPNNVVDAYALLNLALRIDDLPWTGLGVDVTVHNVLDQRYEQGGSVLFPYPQPGRWFLIRLSYHL